MQSHPTRTGRRRTRAHIALAVAASALTFGGATVAADSFTFTIDPAQSSLAVTVSGLFGSDSDASPVAGTLGGDLALPAYPFAAARLTMMDASLQETLSLSPGSFLGRINATATGVAFAVPGPQNKGVAGPAAAVAADGSFAQTGNLLEGRGILAYAGTGIYAGVAGSRDLAADPPAPADFAGTLTQSGSTLRAVVPLDVTQVFDVQNGTTSIPVTVRTRGTIVATAPTSASAWTADADAAWGNAGNWNNGVPTAAGPVNDAVFGPVITAPRTILAGGQNARPRRLYIASDQPYTFAPGTSAAGIILSDSIRASGAATHVIGTSVISAGPVSFDVAAPTTLRVDRFTNDSAASTTKTGEGVLEFRKITYSAPLVVRAGTVRLADPAAVTGSLVTGLTVDPGATFDLGGEALVVNYSAGPTPFAGLVSAVTAGRAGGTWTGAGITSNAAAADPRTAVAVVEASDLFATAGSFYGATRDATSVLLLHTLAGDANLDRTVNFADLLALARNYNTAAGGAWVTGDSNYDGAVNFNDLLALARNYNQALPADPIPGAPAGFERELAAAFARVPEPTVGLAGFATCVLALVGRCRRSRP